jgi:hypothetical protein
VLLCVLLAVAGCGGPATAAVDGPSAAARMVCARDAQREISLSLGQTLRQPITPQWSDHLYSCRYVYPAGTVGLSVKQLSTLDAATTYYAAAHGVAVAGLGQAAYAEPDGSLVVRKDSLVLRVDVHGLASAFGQPPLSRAEAARRVAADIMNCWAGS